MGEYANRKRDSEVIKIGTCSSMYYCTPRQRHEVNYNWSWLRNNACYWRLPLIGKAKEAGDGDFEDWKTDRRTVINEEKFWEIVKRDLSINEMLEKTKGLIQLKHDNGYLLNLSCYHNYKLPEIKGDENVQIFWNGKRDAMRIRSIYTKGSEVYICISCKYCEKDFIVDLEELKELLTFTDEYEKDHQYIKEERFEEQMYNAIKAEIDDYLAEYGRN